MAYRDGYETKKAIIGICLDLMHDTPPEDINVSDIAEAAALSRQTFYYHFHSVYDILPWIIGNDFRQMSEDIATIDNINPMDYLIILARTIMKNKETIAKFLPAYRDKMHAELLSYVNRRMREYLCKALSDVVDGNAIEVLSNFHAAGYAGMIEQWMDRGMDNSIFEMAERIRESYPVLLSAEVNARIRELQSMPVIGE